MRWPNVALTALVPAVLVCDVAAFTSPRLWVGIAPSATAIPPLHVEFARLQTRFGATTFSTEQAAALFDEDVVRKTYDEWRKKYNRGEFDGIRFENFKNNYNLLTAANLEAREKAEKEGRPEPKWMTLNEYGDYTQEEYKDAMSGGTSLPAAAPATSSRKTYTIEDPTSSPPAPVPVPSDEVVVPGSEAKKQIPATQSETAEIKKRHPKENKLDGTDQPQTTAVNGTPPLENINKSEAESGAELNEECRKVYDAWCAKYGLKGDALRFATFSTNYLAMREYSLKTGQKLQLNRYADYTREEYASVLQKNASPSSRAIPKNPATVPAQTAQSAAQRTANNPATLQPQVQKTPAQPTQIGTQTQTSDSSVSQGGRTAEFSGSSPSNFGLPNDFGRPSRQISERQDAYGRTIRSTLPVSPVEEENVKASEETASSVPSRPTQRVDPRTDQPLARPTQVIKQSGTVRSTQPIRGTRVLQKAPVENSEETYSRQSSVPGTQVIRKADGSIPNLNPKEAPVRDQYTPNPKEGVEGTQVIKRADQRQVDEAPIRGTRVVSSKGVPVRGTVKISSGDDSNSSPSSLPTVRGTQVVSSRSQPSGTQVIRKVNDASTIRGTQVIRKAEQPPIQGTQVIRKAEQPAAQGPQVIRPAEPSKRKTLQIDDPGALEDEYNESTSVGEDSSSDSSGIPARSTKVVKKNTDLSGDIQPRGTIVIQRNPNENEEYRTLNPNSGAPIRGTVVVRKKAEQEEERSPIDEFASSVFSFFGGQRTEQETPTPIRGTIVIQKSQNLMSNIRLPSLSLFDDDATPSRPVRKTLVINKDAGNDEPPLFSFFGGAKIESSSSPVRQTIVIKKPQNYFEAAMNIITGEPQVEVVPRQESPSQKLRRIKAERAAEASAKAERARLDRISKQGERKKLEDTQKAKRATISMSQTPNPNPSTFTMFGGFKTKPDELKGIATLSGWKQLATGVIVGNVSGSKQYKSNTRITTSPVKRGVKPGDVVTTKSGTQYKLL